MSEMKQPPVETIVALPYWDVVPLMEVGGLRFGMGFEDVEKILGPSTLRQTALEIAGEEAVLADRYRDIVMEYRVPGELGNSGPVLSYARGRLSCVELQPRHGPVRLARRDLFAMTGDDVIAWLGKRAGTAWKGRGAVIFPDLGIALPEQEEEESFLSVSVFGKGAYDVTLEADDYERYRF